MTTHRPTLSFLDSNDAESIINDACRVLETCGVLIENKDGAHLLQNVGAQKKDGRFLLSEDLVRSSVKKAPPKILMYNRDGDLAMDLSGSNVHFNPGSAAIHFFESGSRQRRNARCKDVIDMVRLVETLPNYGAQSTAMTPEDVPEEIADRYRLYLALKYGRKPVITGTFLKDGFAPMHEMLLAIRGSQQALAEKPLAIFDCCPSPPLKWTDLTCQCLIDCARANVPAELVSMPLTGATSPVTLREAIVQHTAESLSGIVLHQTANPGAPIIYGGAPAAFDMRHGTTPMGAIETMMIHIGYSKVGKHLGLPTHGYLGLSDAKCPDYQAGMESGIGAVLGAIAGINVISGPGMLDYLLSQSLEKLLLDHEVCGMALRFVRGIEKRPVDITDLMGELISKGEFLSHSHTRQNWRKELSIASPLIDRDTYSDWSAKGSLDAQQRAQLDVARILSQAQSLPLDEDKAHHLEKIIASEKNRLQ